MRVFVIGASDIDTAKKVVTKYAFSNLSSSSSSSTTTIIPFPREEECVHMTVDGTDVLLFCHTFLPSQACVGYTLLLTEKSSEQTKANTIWNAMIDESDMDGPIEIGHLEYETLRIEYGKPGYLAEMVGD
eukprot:6123754-Ditylum_brightwellii.AAC.1